MPKKRKLYNYIEHYTGLTHVKTDPLSFQWLTEKAKTEYLGHVPGFGSAHFNTCPWAVDCKIFNLILMINNKSNFFTVTVLIHLSVP